MFDKFKRRSYKLEHLDTGAYTPEEYAAIMRRSLSVFGTYTVDEGKKTVTYHIVSSSFPNWEGEAQERTIDKLTADEFVNTNPNVAGGRGRASNFYKRVK